jgi:Pyridoxamine 5'-phosphate oxidase
MRKNLQPDQLGDLLTQAHCAILATHQGDGALLLAPVWHEWTDGGFTIVIDGNDPKIRNLRRDPRFTVVVAKTRRPIGVSNFVAKRSSRIYRRFLSCHAWSSGTSRVTTSSRTLSGWQPGRHRPSSSERSRAHSAPGTTRTKSANRVKWLIIELRRPAPGLGARVPQCHLPLENASRPATLTP